MSRIYKVLKIVLMPDKHLISLNNTRKRRGVVLFGLHNHPVR